MTRDTDPSSRGKAPRRGKATGKKLCSKEPVLEGRNISPKELEYFASLTDDGDLMPDTRDPIQLQSALASQIKQMCKGLGIPCPAARRIADYILSLAVEGGRKKVMWSQRKGKDQDLTPIEFMEKYWGNEKRLGNFYQADLREADKSLFEAIRKYCRNRNEDPRDYLPPPLKKRTEKRRDLLRAAFSKAGRDTASVTRRSPVRAKDRKPGVAVPRISAHM